MSRRWLEMSDSWTLRPTHLEEGKKHLFECTDNKSNSGHSLLVKFAATHAGKVNTNFRFYRPDKVLAATHTWTSKPTAAPVLIEHNKKGDVMGRVRSARYVDEIHKFDQEYPILRDTAFYNSSSNRIPLHDSVDWIVENLGDQEDFSGLGYIELGTQITNPEAIRKVFNDEYLNVSVGFRTDAAICSICHTDWAAEDKCKHRLGQKVNGKDTFLITGNLDYNEVSFVNFPADPFATRLSVEQFTDSLNKRFYLGLSHKEQEALIDASGLTMADSLISYEDDISVVYEDSMDLNDFKLESLDNFLTEIKSKDLTATKAFEYKAAVDSLKPETPEDKTKVRSFASTLNARIRKEKWVLETDADLNENENEELNSVVEDTTEQTDSAVNASNVWENFTYPTEEEKTFFEDAEGINTEIQLELTNAGFTDSTYSPALDLELSSFCGPNKSFAIFDAKSAMACKAALAKATISSSTKTLIEKEILNREKSLGILVEDKLENDQVFNDAKKEIGDKIVGCYNDLHSDYLASDEAMRGRIRGLHYAVAEHWRGNDLKESAVNRLINSGHNVNAYGDALDLLGKFYTEATDSEVKSNIVKGFKELFDKFETTGFLFVDSKDNSIIPSSELADKEDAINELTAELSAEKIKSASYFKESKRSLASQVVMSKIIAGTDGFKDLSGNKLTEKVNELSKRHITSLRDSVKDILIEQKFLVNSSTDSQEITARVDETTQVSEADINLNLVDSTEPAKDPNQDEGLYYSIASAKRYISSPAEQARFFAEKRWATRKTA
jgi:hypothetical protein